MINDPNEIIARLYPVDAGSGGGGGGGTGQNLTILQPNGQSAVYNGSAEVTADARPKTLTIKSPDGSEATYDGSAATTANVKIGRLVIKTPTGSANYDGSGLTTIAIGSGTNGAIGSDDLDPAIKTALQMLTDFPTSHIYDVAAYIENPPDGKSLRKAGYDDDGDVIQRVINLARAQQLGGAPGALVYFAPGVYKVTHTLFYYSDMAFVFAKGARIDRTSHSYDEIIPGDVFSNWFEESFTSYATATAGGSYARRFTTENVAFIGGDFYGNPSATNAAGAQKGPAMIACCHARNIRIVGCTFHGNHGAHCIEINSSDHVDVSGCRLYGYESDGKPLYSEMIQIDAANNSGYGSKLGGTISNVTVGGQSFKSYTVDENTNQRTLGGYYAYTRIAGNASNRAGRLLADMQCCHNVQVHECMIETTTAAAAVGDHLAGDATDTSVSAPTWGSNRDTMKFIKIYNNHFFGPGNSDSGQNYRGVISFGEALSSADIYENVFENTRTAATYDVAIGCRASSPSLTAFKNRYINFPVPTWEETGGGSVDPTVTTIPWESYITTGGPTPFTPPYTPSARIYTKGGRLYGHIRFGNNSTDSINFFGATHITKFAHVNQAYRPHAGDSIEVDAAVTGWAREAGGGAYHPVAGYISCGSSTSAMQLICDSTAAMQAVVIDFEYAL